MKTEPDIDLVAWMSKHGLNQKEAAKWLGIGRRSWQRYESKLSPVPLYVRLAMAARDAGLEPFNG